MCCPGTASRCRNRQEGGEVDELLRGAAEHVPGELRTRRRIRTAHVGCSSPPERPELAHGRGCSQAWAPGGTWVQSGQGRAVWRVRSRGTPRETQVKRHQAQRPRASPLSGLCFCQSGGAIPASSRALPCWTPARRPDEDTQRRGDLHEHHAGISQNQ